MSEERKHARVEVPNQSEFVSAARQYFANGTNFTTQMSIRGKITDGWGTFEPPSEAHPHTIILERPNSELIEPQARYVCVDVIGDTVAAHQWTIKQGMYDYQDAGYDDLIMTFITAD